MSIIQVIALGLAVSAMTVPGAAHALSASTAPLPPERPSADTGEDAATFVEGIPHPRARPATGKPAADKLVTAKAPARGFAAPVVDAGTAAAVREAVNHIAARRFEAALGVQKRLSDPAARTLIEFLYVRDLSLAAPYPRIRAFLAEHPDWPYRETIRKRLEVALLAQRAKSEAVLEIFAATPPTTSAGMVVHAAALAASGEAERANAMIRELWREASLTDGEEKLVLDRFGGVLTREDHKARMDQLLYNSETSAALRVAKRLGGDELKLAEARIAVIRRSKSAGTALEKLPAEIKRDPGYVLSRVQWHRRADRDGEAAKLLQSAAFETDALIDPDEWALERRIVARELIETGDTKGAYEIVRAHAAESAIDRLENEWHAGWLALRYLKDPGAARRHFAALKDIATMPISQARADYWLGRAAEEAGDIEDALAHYVAAGKHPTTYYGQLALDRIGRTTVPGPRKPIYADTARRIIGRRDCIRAMRILAQIGLKDDAARYMISMANETDDPLTLIGLAETAQLMGLKHGVVWIGKRGSQAGAPADAYAFSTDVMPDYPTVGPRVEPAVVYAVARQESVFNPEAVSPAGARGLMQMMPATAKATAKAYRQPYDLKRLAADARYNATLGAAHLGELADEFDNAYALVFAAYNAGAGRVYEWIKRFGDPRKGEIDPVDWVELIPFSETRNYVQRVMEGLQVYRASLSGDHRLLIAKDLTLPAGRGQAMLAGTTGGVPDVFSGFGDGAPAADGSVPSSALGFGGGL